MNGPLAPHAGSFQAELAGRGYSRQSQLFHLQLMAHVSKWLDERGLDASDLTDTYASEFLRGRRASGQVRFRTIRGLTPLLSFLRVAGMSPPAAMVEPAAWTRSVVGEFAGYLITERGLRPQTVTCYARFAQRFLESLPAKDDEALTELTAEAVRSFVLGESGQRGTGSLKNAVTAVRSLLGFLHLRGLISSTMDGAVPAAAGWHRPPLTRRLNPADVASVLGSCDRHGHAGRRDYAILILLVRLGLRAGEAAAIRTGDIDWRAGEILVRGKGGRDERLPLPVDVGAAIADYCRAARPQDAVGGMLFLHSRAPYGPLTPSAVGHIVVRACRRSGLESASAHQLRHAAATTLRRAGAPPSEISQLLRHRNEGTTARYGTIDPEEMVPVTAPWPQAAS